MKSRLSPLLIEQRLAQSKVPGPISNYLTASQRWSRQQPLREWIGRHGLTSSEYQKAFDEQMSAGFRLVSVSGYSDTGIARYAAIWHKDEPSEWRARHGLDGAGYQQAFDDLSGRGFRPVQVCGYGDGFYSA
jgi:hypothetical protein